MYKKLAEMIEKETGIVYGEGDFDRLKFRVEKLKELSVKSWKIKLNNNELKEIFQKH